MTAVPPTRILVADDDPWMLFLMRTLLDLLPGAEVVGEAHDGEEALRLVAESDPDVALLDIQMPGLDGLTAAEVIRSRWPSVRVVLHTGAYQDDQYHCDGEECALHGSNRSESRSRAQRPVRLVLRRDQEVRHTRRC